MELYTFIMDYFGGTYISQVEAQDKEQARDLWIKELDVTEIESFTVQDKEDLLTDGFSDEDQTPLRGIKNVWFFTIKTESGNGYVNVIKTNSHQ